MAYISGSGASGLTGALSYTTLIDAGFSPKSTLLLMLLVPLVFIIAFYSIKEKNNANVSTFIPEASSSTTSLLDDSLQQSTEIVEESSLNFSQKILYIPKLLKYFIPMIINYLCEYTMNQGLVSFRLNKKNSTIEQQIFINFNRFTSFCSLICYLFHIFL